jgi:hypothetical protein
MARKSCALCSLLPLPLVVHFVGQDLFHKHNLRPEIDERHESVAVISDVEDGSLSHEVGINELSFDIRLIPPPGRPNGSHPVRQCEAGVGIFLAEFLDAALADDPQESMFP